VCFVQTSISVFHCPWNSVCGRNVGWEFSYPHRTEVEKQRERLEVRKWEIWERNKVLSSLSWTPVSVWLRKMHEELSWALIMLYTHMHLGLNTLSQYKDAWSFVAILLAQFYTVDFTEFDNTIPKKDKDCISQWLILSGIFSYVCS